MAAVQEEDIALAEARDIQQILLQQRYRNALQEIELLQKDLAAVRLDRDVLSREVAALKQAAYLRGRQAEQQAARPRDPKDVAEISRLRAALETAEADLQEIQYPSSGVVDVPTLEATNELP